MFITSTLAIRAKSAHAGYIKPINVLVPNVFFFVFFTNMDLCICLFKSIPVILQLLEQVNVGKITTHIVTTIQYVVITSEVVLLCSYLEYLFTVLAAT